LVVKKLLESVILKLCC